MNQEQRNEKRQNIFNSMLFALQLLGAHNTFSEFVDVFETRMKEEVGEYLVEDEEWVIDGLERFKEHMEKHSKG